MKTTTRDDLLQGVTDALYLFPFSLAVGALSGFGAAGGCMAAAVSLVCGAVFRVSFRPTYLALLPVFAAAYRFGASAGAATVLLGGVFAFLLHVLPQRLRGGLRSPATWAGFSVAAAFATTALQTTNYFGIGAVGGTVPTILRDYVSLGFHPNWRGILYGTIVMVVLITYPRKFKTLSKTLPAAFVSLLVTLPLHGLLVPDARHSPVDELGALTFRLPDGAFLRGTFPAQAWPVVLCGALSLAILVSAGLPQNDVPKLSAACVVNGFLGGVPIRTDGAVRNRLCSLTAAPVTVLLFLTPGLARTPLPSLAVILIVTAWQQVDWSAARRALRPRTLPFFACAVLLPVLFGMHYMTPLLAVAGLAEAALLHPSEDDRER